LSSDDFPPLGASDSLPAKQKKDKKVQKQVQKEVQKEEPKVEPKPAPEFSITPPVVNADSLYSFNPKFLELHNLERNSIFRAYII